MCCSDTTELAVNTVRVHKRVDRVGGSASPAACGSWGGRDLTLCRETLALVDHLVLVLDPGAVGTGQLHLLLTDSLLAATFTLVIHHICSCRVSVGEDNKREQLILHVGQLKDFPVKRPVDHPIGGKTQGT